MSAEAEAADIAVGGRAEPISQFAMIAHGKKRVGPGAARGDVNRRQQSLIQRDVTIEAPHADAHSGVEILVGFLERPIQEHRRARIYRRSTAAAAEDDVAGSDPGPYRSVDEIAEEAVWTVTKLDLSVERYPA